MFRVTGLRARALLALMMLGLLVQGVALSPTVGRALATPEPGSVTSAGSLQSEVGCSGDWDPGCAASHLARDAGDGIWRGSWALPAGGYEYKAALNDSWDENYGLHAQRDGANIPLNLPGATSVKFYYDHRTHWVTDNYNSVIAS